MSLALAIDCSAPEIGLAMGSLGDPRPRWAWSARADRGADGLLGPALVEALAQRAAGEALQHVIVAVGPGTFTGLRVGLATALGVALAAEVPVIPVCSLLARAAQITDEVDVLALLDGRKQRMYGASFRCGPGLPLARGPVADLPLDALLPAGHFVAVGEGAVVAAARVEAAGGRVHPQASAPPLGALLRVGALLPAMDPAAVELRYVRPPDAVVPAALAARRALGVGTTTST
ncbi:MAG: tRNA (adenosine(37)-N6)-threonylcarbamoyltransferase complex dimerization subunit type 1 TsaB [Deltaproteobacteria bacterium]|nr:tRNA (adenosine(37)-N6)-threonylcarbamoyltransferase complex dimerization subunit type 1 TsaB [Deltaproteobacteria bacterium]